MIEGFGVYLDTLREENLHQYLQWRNDERIFKWCRQFDLITEREHQAWFEKIQTDPSTRMYEMLDSVNLRLIGVCGLTSVDHKNQSAEFSLYVEPDFQGCGAGSKALKLLVKHGFENLNLNHIFGETFEDNPAAKVFEKLGFTKEGTRRQFYNRRGKFIDAHLYSMLRSDKAWQEWH